jgi:uncharacterized spore protein YtfJ
MPTQRSPNAAPRSREPQTAPSHRTVGDAIDAVTGPIESLVRTIGIDTVYGAPVTKGRTTVVPVAEVRTGFGFGRDPASEAQIGGGGGGGAGLRITPRGYLEITTEGVRYRPIYSYTPFVAGGALLGGLLYRLLAR